MKSQSFFDGKFGRYVLPGIILQSVLIGGGFATGREVVEFGAKFGALGWAGGLGIFIGFTVMAILTFEVARLFHAFDYRSLIKQFAGPLWVAYDVVYFALAVLIIAVMASATGEILQQTLGLNYWVGVIGITALVGILNFYGEKLIERFKTLGTAALFLGYIIFAIIVISSTSDHATQVFASGDTSFAGSDVALGAVLWSGILYVGYNLAVYPAALFTIKRQTSRRQSVWSGIIAGLLMTIPWFLTYFSLMGHYPSEEVLGASVPWLVMLQDAGAWVVVLFGLVVGWTLIETSTGIIRAFLDRLDTHLKEYGKSGLSGKQSALISILALAGSVLLAQVGIIGLIAKGYTFMAYVMIAVYAIPLLTIGVIRIINPQWAQTYWKRYAMDGNADQSAKELEG